MKKLTFLIVTLSLLTQMVFAINVTINLQDSDGNPLSGGTLQYRDGSWSTATETSTGVFTATISGTNSVEYRMTYNNARQSITKPGTVTTVNFVTVTVDPALENSDGNDLAGGNYKYYGSTWSADHPANTAIELLPGSYRFRMTYNSARQEKTGITINPVPSQKVSFQTVTVDPALEDSDGNDITGGSYKFEESSWSGDLTPNTNIELLPGTYRFRMEYNSARQEKTGITINPVPSQKVSFQTVTVDPALEDSDGNDITGGSYKFEESSWSGDLTPNTNIELLPGTYRFRMEYNSARQEKTGITINPVPSQKVSFQTVTVDPALEDSDGNDLTGGSYKFEENSWSGSLTPNTNIELLPGTYEFRMEYNNARQEKTGITINPVASQQVLFQTVTVTVSIEDCNNNPLSGGNVQHYGNNWSSKYSANNQHEMLPVSYDFRMYFNDARKEKTETILASNNSQEVRFQATKVNFVYNGTVKYYGTGWGVYTQGMYLLPDTYKFRFDNYEKQLTVPEQCVFADYNIHIFKTVKADNSALPNIKIYRNDYSNHYVHVGTTDANGILFATTIPGGTWKFKATKDHTQQYLTAGPSLFNFQTSKFITHVKKHDGTDFPNINVDYNDYSNHYIDLSPAKTDASGKTSIELFPGNYKFRASKDHSNQYKYLDIADPGKTETVVFQTSNFIAHVKHTDGSDFQGINVDYNDYSNHYIDLSPSTTDASGKTSIELFPGNYKFKANKDHTNQYKYLNINTEGTTGTVVFQTSTFKAHVMKHDGTDFPGIEVEYNDYSNHYIDLTPKYTAADGTSSIELFPGKYTFRAKKNKSTQYKDLEITSSGVTQIVNFQTALAVGLVKDCDNNNPVPNVEIEYNDYSNHWIDVSPKYTGADGKGSIELFPGTYDLRAKNLKTYSQKSITLTHPTTTVEFNPTRVCFHYPGGVKYNDYSNHWVNLPCNSYMFPGTYKFKFGSMYKDIAISGCSMEKAPIFVQLQDNNGNGISGPSFKYRYGYGSSTSIGTDNTGNGIFYLLDGNPSKTKVTVSYKGASIEKEQNVQNNPNFIFNTVPVSVELLESDNTTDITNDATYKFRYGYGSYTTFDPLTQPMQLLPVKTKMHISYRGTSLEREQNVGNDAIFNFQTVNVTASLNEGNSSTALTADNWQFRYSYGSYSGFNNTGEELLPVNTKVKVSYKGESVEKQQNVATDPHFDFNTIKVTAKLNNSNGVEITNNVSFDYRYGYASFKPFNGPIYLLPANTKIKVNYRGTSVSKEQNVGSAPDFVFNTVPVTAKVEDSQGNPITSGVSYKYRYGWGTKYIFTSPMELLPVATKVSATYAGKTVEKEQNVNSNPDFVFTTAKATALVLDINSLPVSGATIQYRYGWESYMNLGTTDNNGLASKEIFTDGSVSFRATYDTYDETQTLPLVYNSNPDVIFNSDLDVTTFPIELTSFNATNRAQDVLLRWTTATEINNDYFTLERSTDTENWTIIGTVDGAGNSNTSLNYRFVDDEAPNGGIVYYRLKQTDFDGKFEYSDIIDVNRSNSNNVELTVSPVPSTGIINLNSNQTFGNSRIIIIDNAGNKVYDKQGVSDKLDLSFLQNGLYHIRLITDEHQMISRKIIISR